MSDNGTPTLKDIREALERHTPHSTRYVPGERRASVAMILTGAPEDLRLCFIRRAEREGDPWSGHMAFPGGRADLTDPDTRAVAERETDEEIGLSLAGEDLLAPLSEMPIRLGGVDIGMTLSPFVYHLAEEPAALHLSDEVAAAYWISLAHLWDPAQTTHLELNRNGNRLVYPAIRFRDTVIWGLTYRVLTMFSDVLEHPLPHLEEIPGLGR